MHRRLSIRAPRMLTRPKLHVDPPESFGRVNVWRLSVLELADDRAVADGLTDVGLEPGDRPGLVRLERLLHLHRLDDDHGVALGDLLALLDDDLDDGALH